MVKQGQRNVLAIIMSAYRSKASWERYQNDVADAVETVGDAQPSIRYLEDLWHLHSGFINAIAERIRIAYNSISASHFADASLIFTAHGNSRSCCKDLSVPRTVSSNCLSCSRGSWN